MRKGVSTYIAAIFILFIFAAFMASLIMIIRGWSDLMTNIVEKEEMAAERARESLTIDNVTISGGNIIIGVRNTGSVDVHLIKYYVRNLNKSTVSFGNLNEYIAVGTSKYITVAGSYDLSDNYLIALITSRNNIVKVTYPYTPSTPPAVPTNITYSLNYAPVIFSNYTVASLGFNSTESVPTSPTGYEVLAGNQILSAPLIINSTYTTVYEFPGFKDWRYYKVINITENTGSDLTDYTVKIVLNSSNFNFSRAKDDGSDVRFVWSDKTTVLDYWIERWDSAAQEAVIWVKVPKLAGGQNTTIYMLYGNQDATYDPEHHGLTKVMEPLPASDGGNYNIQYEVWVMTTSMFNANNAITPMNWFDDDNAWNLFADAGIDFKFPFYSFTFGSNDIYVDSNGFIAFGGDPDGEYGTSHDETDLITGSNEYGSIYRVAPFWADLYTGYRGTQYDDMNIYVNSSYADEFGNGIYIRWKTTFWDLWITDKNGEQNFGVTLYANGLIRFDYGYINGKSNIGDTVPVVGVSLGDSVHYTIIQDYDGVQYPSNYPSVMLWPKKVADKEPTVTIIPSGTSDYQNGKRTYLVSTLAYWSGVAPATVIELDMSLNISSATPSTYELEVYENSTGVWRFLNSYTLTSGTLSTISVPVNKYYPSGTIGFMLNITGEVPFNATFNYVALTYRVLGDPLLAVATNGSNKLYLYDLVTEKWFSVTLPSGSFINPSVVFDYVNMSFRVLNGTHVITYDPYYRRSSVDLALSEVAHESAFILSLNGYLLYAPGGGSNTLYVYDLSSGANSTYTLPEGVEPYTCTAYDPNNDIGYVLFGNTGDIYNLTINESGALVLRKAGLSPTALPVGLTFGNGLLWVISKGGGIHKINPSTGIATPLNIQPPYYPLSEGDRLVYVSAAGAHYLYHIREDSTSEVWVIKVS